MQPVGTSPPRQGRQRTLTSEEDESSNRSNSSNNSNSYDETRHYDTNRNDDGTNGHHRSSCFCPPRINSKDSHSGQLSSTQTNQQQQQQQPRQKPPPTSQSEPSLLSTTSNPTSSASAVAATKFSFFQLWGRHKFMPSSATPGPPGFVSPHTTLLPMRRAVSESVVTQESLSASPDQIVVEVFGNNTSTAPLTSTLRRALTPLVLVRSTLRPSSSPSSSVICSDSVGFVIDGGASCAEPMRHMGMENAALSSTLSASSSPTSTSSSTSSSSCFRSLATEIHGRTQGYDADFTSGNTSEYNGATLSRQQESLAVVQERIVHGQDQLKYYRSLVLDLEKGRDEAIQLLTRIRHERDALADEIESLERALTSDPVSFSRRGSASRYQSLFSNTAGHIWTMSPPTLLRRNSPGGTEVDCSAATSCCSSDLPPTTLTARGTGPLVHSKSASFASIAAPPMETASSSSSWTVVPSFTLSTSMCHRCCERATVVDKRTRLNQIQGEVERIQQRVRFLESRLKHMERTFIEPIMGCLANDSEECTRLRAQDRT